MAAEKPTLTFVTGNKKKLEEVKLYLAGAGEENLPYSIVNKKLDLPELQGSSPEEIAKEKCKLAAKQVEGGAVMIEDTCLCFKALEGLPGPYIKWFLDKLGLDGLVRLISGWTNKDAYASAIFALCEGPDKEPLIFEGITEGKIVDKKGPEDFGWDPIFKPNEGEGKTFAEMAKEAKNAISHRGRALEKLRKHLLGEQATSSPKKRTHGETTDEEEAKRQKTA